MPQVVGCKGETLEAGRQSWTWIPAQSSTKTRLWKKIILLLSYAQFPQERKNRCFGCNKHYCKGSLYPKEWASAYVATLQFCLIKADMTYTFTETPVKGKTETVYFSLEASINLLSRELEIKKRKRILVCMLKQIIFQ